MPDWFARIIRTALQIGAAGGFTALITEGSKIIDARFAPLVLALSVIIVSFCQNLIEQQTGYAILKPNNAQTEKA